MKNGPFITYVMPAYNAEATIAQAIWSLLDKKHRALSELIVVDDASTDSTPKILAWFVEYTKKRTNPVRVITLKANIKPAQARNIGNKEAQGEWIAVADADDVSDVNRSKNIKQAVDKYPDVELVYFDYLDADQWLTPIRLFKTNPTIIYKELECQTIPHAFCTYRKNLALGFPYSKGLGTAEDYEFFLRCLFANVRTQHYNKVAGIHRGNIGVASTDRDSMLKKEAQARKFYYDLLAGKAHQFPKQWQTIVTDRLKQALVNGRKER